MIFSSKSTVSSCPCNRYLSRGTLSAHSSQSTHLYCLAELGLCSLDCSNLNSFYHSITDKKLTIRRADQNRVHRHHTRVGVNYSELSSCAHLSGILSHDYVIQAANDPMTLISLSPYQPLTFPCTIPHHRHERPEATYWKLGSQRTGRLGWRRCSSDGCCRTPEQCWSCPVPCPSRLLHRGEDWPWRRGQCGKGWLQTMVTVSRGGFQIREGAFGNPETIYTASAFDFQVWINFIFLKQIFFSKSLFHKVVFRFGWIFQVIILIIVALMISLSVIRYHSPSFTLIVILNLSLTVFVGSAISKVKLTGASWTNPAWVNLEPLSMLSVNYHKLTDNSWLLHILNTDQLLSCYHLLTSMERLLWWGCRIWERWTERMGCDAEKREGCTRYLHVLRVRSVLLEVIVNSRNVGVKATFWLVQSGKDTGFRGFRCLAPFISKSKL